MAGTYHVVYEGSKQYPWRVKKEKGSRAVSKHRKKKPAKDKANDLAGKNGTVKVHRKDGKLGY